MKDSNPAAILNALLPTLASSYPGSDLSRFYARLGQHFGDLFRAYRRIYGDRPDFPDRLGDLVRSLAGKYLERPPRLRRIDLDREERPHWLLSPEWVSTMLYVDRFAGDLRGFIDKIPYLRELGINYVHLMPLLASPEGENDGGYAVKDYRSVDPRLGTMEDLRRIAELFSENGMLLELDLVLNHSSDQHEWARRALAGEQRYQEYYYLYPDRSIPEEFEKTLPEVFPDLAPGNFTYRPEIDRWVFTVFNSYQWDLNYTNPEVLREMAEILLFLANQGVDVLRLDAVAFLWKRLGTNSQNEPEAHAILQIFRSCAKIVAPGVAFKAEAIVQPIEIVKYLGEGEASGKECEIAYNASLMVFLWDALATRNAKLLTKGLQSMPRLPRGTTWVNYLRSHDDIGLGFADSDAAHVGYDPALHRKFLVDYYTGVFPGSPARGEPFMYNPRTGDARISGSLASLAGLESALEAGDEGSIDLAVRRILLLHAAIMAFGGVPLIYCGDELGTVNDRGYRSDPALAGDNRWMHRPRMDWVAAERRHLPGTVEHRIFSGLRRMIALRKGSPEFHGENDYLALDPGNPQVFAFLRESGERRTVSLLNFSPDPQGVALGALSKVGLEGPFLDKFTGLGVEARGDRLELGPYGFLWLTQADPEDGQPGD